MRRRWSCCAAVGLWLSSSVAPALAADPSAMSDASLMIPVAVGFSVVGAAGLSGSAVSETLRLSVDGATLVVESVEIGANGVVIALTSLGDGASFSLELAGDGAIASGWIVGESLKWIASGAGGLLVRGDSVAAIVPNAEGERLFHNEQLTP